MKIFESASLHRLGWAAWTFSTILSMLLISLFIVTYIGRHFHPTGLIDNIITYGVAAFVMYFFMVKAEPWFRQRMMFRYVFVRSRGKGNNWEVSFNYARRLTSYYPKRFFRALLTSERKGKQLLLPDKEERLEEAFDREEYFNVVKRGQLIGGVSVVLFFVGPATIIWLIGK